jgi:hypothetical protein
LTKEAKARRAYVYLDEQHQKGFEGPFTNRSAGTRQINVVAVIDDYKTVAAEANVKMEVK